jgi:glycosyltransferase involved in cell wall biosynthesis
MARLYVADQPGVLANAGAKEADGRADLAVVIPAFNEQDGIGQTIGQLRAALADEPYVVELVVVDDGSTDDTADQAQRSGAHVLRLPVNRGYGAALKAGIAATSAEYIVIIDADGTYPAEAIPDLMRHAGGADMVVGARSSRFTNVPLLRRPAKWFLNKLASYLAGQTIPDVNSGLRVLRRSALQRFLPILPSGFSFTTTITLAMLCSSHAVVYRPIKYQPRIGSSKIRPAHFVNFVMLVLRTVVLFNPLKVFLPVGTLLFLLGLAKLAQDLWHWNLSETAVMGFLSGITVWSLGLLADMLSRLHLFPPGER